MDATLEWCDCLEGRKIEKLIRQGHSPNEAVKIVRENHQIQTSIYSKI
jgi:hypothetical protein